MVISLGNSMTAYAVEKQLGDIGIFPKWEKVEIQMTGPFSTGTGSPNPFDILVDVTFTGPSGQTYLVPGFYDGDGLRGLDGNVWKVRFSADETGTWTFLSSSADAQLNGYSGSFTVTEPAPTAPNFYQGGRLEYVGTETNKIRYLKFREGPYWLKAGCDDPENFLGNFSSYDTPAKRFSAVDYLSGKGINSLYMMTHNIDGDNQDVWPWLGTSAAEAKTYSSGDVRFDVAKLEEWRELFEHMQKKGVVPYLVLEDDSAWSGYDHGRYYRELIARFGYLPALIFNFGEEYSENYSLNEALPYMQVLKDIDPYDHPRGIHNVNLPDDAYVTADQVDFTSIQTGSGGPYGSDPLEHNQLAIDWINRCETLNRRVLMVGFDEPRPLMDRKGWWSAYVGGGVWEVHVDKPYDRPMSTWETAWNEIGGARVFMETLPFWEMKPQNALVTSGTALCLAKQGEAYALYLPSGGSVTVNLAGGNSYDYSWWNPTNDKHGSFQDGGTTGGGLQTLEPPGSGDWALRIVKSSSSDSTPPTVPVIIDATAVSQSQINIEWQASGDPESGISHYQVYRDNVFIGQSNTTSHADGGLTAGTSYTYEVSAVNHAGLESLRSSPATVTTLTDGSALAITNLWVASGEPYEIVSNGLQIGGMVYVDRAFVFTQIPNWVEGATYIKTANDDKSSSDVQFMEFDVNQDVTVYIAHDDRIAAKPSWMNSFTDTGSDLVTSDATLSVFKREFSAGTVTLGGNEGTGSSMYSVMVIKRISDTVPPKPPTNLRLQ
jgi:hypothetical protein